MRAIDPENNGKYIYKRGGGGKFSIYFPIYWGKLKGTSI